MADGITLYIEGAAEGALDELLAIDGLTVRVEQPDDTPRRSDDWLSLTANILQIVSAPLVAREFLSWFQRNRERAGAGRFTCVLVRPDGTRLNLETATETEMIALLRGLAAKPEPGPESGK